MRINPSDLPPIESIVPKPRVIIPQSEIDHIKDLIVGMRRQAKQILKDAIIVGEWFLKTRQKLNRRLEWSNWVRENFPKVHFATIWNYQRLAANREFLSTFDREILTITEALRLISQQQRMDKPRVRTIVVKADAEPEILLEAKIKNYVINLWMLRYQQTEIEGLILAMGLKPDQLLRILRYVCKEHHEVEEEVVRTFSPKLKIVQKNT